MAAKFSYIEEKLLSEMIRTAIANGNRAVGKPFEPDREQYIMLCDMANRVDADIERMHRRKSRAPAATRENQGGFALQLRCGPFPLRLLEANHT